MTNYYVYGLGLLYEADDAGNTKTYHSDYRGSTVALTDGSGNVTDRAEYSAYGTLTYRVGNTDTPFLFNGRHGVQSDANGLLHMRARYYNPYLARFLNADPSGFGGGLNFYAYADGNPVSLIDPFGLGAVGASTGRSWVQAQSWYQDLQTMQAGARQYGATPSGGQIFNTFLDFVPGGTVAKSFYTLSTGRELGTGAWSQRSDAQVFGEGLLGVATLVPFGSAGSSVVRAELRVARTTRPLYRAVSHAEYADITANGVLRPGPNSYEFGKFFAETGEHADQWGGKLEGAGNFRVIEAQFPTSTANQFKFFPHLDNIGLARFGTFEQLGQPTIRLWPGSP